jgi:hypothetical protein
MTEGNEPVLVLAPTGRDAILIEEALRRLRLPTHVCSDLEQFATHLQQEAAAGLLAQEALRSGAAAILHRAVREQPAW